MAVMAGPAGVTQVVLYLAMLITAVMEEMVVMAA
jgi:hypothetical protein